MDRSPSPVGSTSRNSTSNVESRTRQRNVPTKGPIVLTAGVARKPRMSNPLKKLLQQKQKSDPTAFLEDLTDTDEELDLLRIDSLAVASSEGDMDMDSTESRVAQLLGSKDGKAVGKILVHDRDHHTKNVKVVGIRFFAPKYNVTPSTTNSLTLQGEDSTDAVFNVLKKAVHVNGNNTSFCGFRHT